MMTNTSSTNSQEDVNTKNIAQLSGHGMKEAEDVKLITVAIKLLMLTYNSMRNVLLSVMKEWNLMKQ